jgi:hypothetical protein
MRRVRGPGRARRAHAPSTRHGRHAQVLAKINHTEKMKEQQLEKRGGKETDPEVAKQKMERAQLAYAEKEAGCKQIEQEGALRRLHFLGWTRVHLTSMRVVSFLISRPFERPRCSAQVSSYAKMLVIDICACKESGSTFAG